MMYGEAQTTETTELVKILSFLSSQNDKLVTTIQQLESIGHRIKNTDFPQPQKEAAEQKKPDGLLQEIQLQVSYMEAHNNRLQELLNKFSQLL